MENVERSVDGRGPIHVASPPKVIIFLAAFFCAVGLLLMLVCCGTDYWLLGSESCSLTADTLEEEIRENDGRSDMLTGEYLGLDSVRFFHEGLFRRCFFRAKPVDFSVWSLWIPNHPPSKVCQPAYLFPFPVYEPIHTQKLLNLPVRPSEPGSAIVFRTFWSVFLVAGVVTVVIGGFVVICAAPSSNYKLLEIGGALLLTGGLCLLALVVMFVFWVQLLDVLEQFSLRQSLHICPAYHLHVEHGPSSSLAPAAAFFCLLSGLLFILAGRTSTNKESAGTVSTRDFEMTLLPYCQ